MNSNQINVERFCRSAFFVSCPGPKRQLRASATLLSFSLVFVLLLRAEAQEDVGQAPVPLTAQNDAADQDGQVGSPQQPADDIKQWINDLTNSSFLVRQHAKTKLRKAGAAAYSQLYRAKNNPDLEARLTIQELLSQIQIQWVGSKDSQRVIDLMLDFQTRKPEDRLAIVDRLSWFPQKESWQPLYRVVLYDPSVTVSNHAAGRLLQICFLRDDRPTFDVQTEYESLSSRRYAQLSRFMKSDARWGEKMLASCFAISKQTSIFDPHQIFQDAAQTQVDTIRQRIAKNTLDSQCLQSLLLAQRVLYRFHGQLGGDPKPGEGIGENLDNALVSALSEKTDASDRVAVVDCFLAHSRYSAAQKVASALDGKTWPWNDAWKIEVMRQWGKADQADQMAAEWLARIPDGGAELADGLEALFDWRLDNWAVFVLQNRLKVISTRHRLKLAELERKIGYPDLALKHAAEVFDKSESPQDRTQGATLLAELYREKNDPQNESKWLREVLKVDPLSTFGLIGLHQLSKAVPDLKVENLRAKIDLAKGAYRDQFRLGSQMSQSSTPAESNLGRVKMAEAANSLAWLLFHLDEDRDEAMRVAETAVRLEPFNADYLDTLAWGLFQTGNRKKAVELQKRAVFLAPGDLGKQRQLQKFTGNN